MPKLPENTVPSYRLHRQSGQAIVTLSNKDILLGPHGTAASRGEYRRRLAEWIVNGRRLPRTGLDLTVTELIAAFKVHAEKYYRHLDGTPTGEVQNFRMALRPLRELYGRTQAHEFGPLALDAVRSQMILRGWRRRTINKSVGRIRAMFRWAAARELLPASIYQALTTLDGLRAGKSAAIESDPVKPVPDEVVNATLPHLSPVVGGMVQLQRLTGARPGEICTMRISDIDRSGTVWTYTPSSHKTAHHGHRRTIFIGPKAQAILGPFMLKIDATSFCFSPADADRDRRTNLHAERKTPLSCGNRPGTNQRRRPKRKPGQKYSVDSYRRAIARACDVAFPPPAELLKQGKESDLADWRQNHRWYPHRLRHSAATEIRAQFGIEAAQHILGHASLNITELYAAKNDELARSVAEKIG